jgi:hypothetical protein
MIGYIGEDVIMIRGIMRDGENPIKSGSVGRLVEIYPDKRAAVFFEGKGRYTVLQDAIRGKAFATGDDVMLHDTIPGLHRVFQPGERGVIRSVIAENGNYHYNVFIDGECVLVRSHLLRKFEASSMVISELAKYMISVGSGVNYRSVPEWFQSVVNVLKDTPKLSQMDPAQLEFIIRKFMEYRRVDSRADLVANVLFGIQSSASSTQLRSLEQKLHGYKEKLDIEWKKLDKIIPIEFQYASLRAFAESQND